jgi:hypothetical protein
VRLHDAKTVAQAGVDDAVILEHPPYLGHDRFRVGHVLVDVVEDDNVHRLRRQRNHVPRGSDELHVVAKPLLAFSSPGS